MSGLLLSKKKKSANTTTTRRTHCKCGSTTHVSTTALDCPLNTRNLRSTGVDEALPPNTPDPDNSKKRKRKRNTHCKCGSTTHLRTSSRACPLNKHNLKDKSPLSIPTLTTDDDANDVTTPRAQPHATDDDANDVTTPPAQPHAVTDAHVNDVTTPPAQPHTVTDDDANDATTPPPPKKTRPKRTYQVNDNVVAKWAPKKWYLSHVVDFQIVNGKKLYTVYCPVDGETKHGLPLSDLREVDSAVTLPKRTDLINSEFTFDGAKDLAAGRWRVVKIVKNTYDCTRLSGGDSNAKKTELFDIGYVMDQVANEAEKKRIQGPICRS